MQVLFEEDQNLTLGGLLGSIKLDLPLLIDASFCAGAAMIAFGAVLGKATPTQLLWMLVFMVPVYSLNQHLVCGADQRVA